MFEKIELKPFFYRSALRISDKHKRNCLMILAAFSMILLMVVFKEFRIFGTFSTFVITLLLFYAIRVFLAMPLSALCQFFGVTFSP